MKIEDIKYRDKEVHVFVDNGDRLVFQLFCNNKIYFDSKKPLQRKYWALKRNLNFLLYDAVLFKFTPNEILENKNGIFDKCMEYAVDRVNRVNDDTIRVKGVKITSILIDELN